MTIFKHGRLSQKEEKIIKSIADESSDFYGDCYVTKNNLRLFIAENLNIVYDSLKNGDKIIYEENEGFILITGYSDKFPRKYIKILTKNDNATNRLIKTLHWHVKEDLYCKIKKNNPVRRILERNGFHWKGDRGKELLLYRKFRPLMPVTVKDKEDEEI